MERDYEHQPEHCPGVMGKGVTILEGFKTHGDVVNGG